MLRLGLLLLSLWVAPVCAQSPAPSPNPSPGSAAPVSVKVATPDDLMVVLERRAPAEVLPLNDSLLAAEVNAVVAEVRTDVGELVQAGDLLVELDRRDFQLQLDAARAALSSARARQAEASAKLERAQRLSKAQYVSEDELLTRETALAVSAAEILNAEAQVAIAQRQLDKCGVFAPFDGVVQERMAQQGAYVTVGTPLVAADPDRPGRTGCGSAGRPGRVPATGDRTGILLPGKQRWDVTLLRLSPVIQAGRRARPARFAFVGEPPPAGQNGELVWRVAGGQLPANLISRRQGGLGVFLVESGAARFLPLPGAQEGRPVPVELPAGALVIVQGQDRLQDGDPVQVR